MSVYKTVGPTGDFSTINLWVADVVANHTSGGALTDNVIAGIQAAGIAPSADDTVSGWTPSASNFTTKITADNTADGGAAGNASFRDNANVRTNALKYNTANGAFINYAASTKTLTVAVDLFTFSDLQAQGNKNYGTTVSLTKTSSTSLSVIGCIFNSTGGPHDQLLNVDGTGSSYSVYNNLFVGNTTATLCMAWSGANNANMKMSYCTFVGASAFAQQVGLGSYGTLVINNCYIDGAVYGTDIVGNAHGYTCNTFNCATTNSSLVYSANRSGSDTATQGSAVNSTEFTSSTTDFRLAAGSVKCKSNGTNVSGITDDISRFTRNASTPCIGAWELASSAVNTNMLPGIAFSILPFFMGLLTNLYQLVHK